MQARYVGEEWRTLLVNMISVSDRNGTVSLYAGVQPVQSDMEQAAQAIHPIRTAILRMDPSSSTFTTNHLYFLRMCLNAGMPRQTLPILDKDIYSFPAQSPKGVDERYPCSDHEVSCNYITKNSGISEQITPMQVQEYYLLGAHVYIGVRQYERARLFLELVLSSPTQHVATPMMVEAYKKLILVGLLSQGATFKLPGTIDHGTLRTVQQLSRAYEALADAFKNRDFVKFHAETDTGIAIWREDGNQGIVNEVAEALNRSRIKDLQKTYSALPLERVAIHLSLSQDSTMRLLTAMIQQNHISATITLPTASQPNPANGTSPSAVLRFVPSASANGNVLTEEALLQSRVEMIKHLNAQLKEADRKLSLTKEYIDWKKRNQKADPGDRMDTSLDMPGGYGEDEDMMSDV